MPIVIFVEGSADERFVQRVIQPVIHANYDWFATYPYAEKKKATVDAYLRSLEAMEASVVFTGDQDEHPCYTRTKQGLRARFARLVDDSIVVVRREIEGWYLAGATARRAEALGVAHLDPETVTKEMLTTAASARSVSRNDLMLELLDTYRLPTALKRSSSLAYLDRTLGGALSA